MAMKLKQRIVLGYYKTKFNTLGKISPSLAAASAFTLFCSPYSGKKSLPVPPVFEKANHVAIKIAGINIKGFHWPATQENARKILICHGFDSSSYRFDKYVVSLLQQGFEVYAFDAPGHGISDGKTINVLVYKDAIVAIQKQFGAFYGVMAHSLGGLATALAAEEMQEPANIVLIAPATETTRAINNFFTYIPLHHKTRTAFENLIQQMSGKTIEWFSVTRALTHIPSAVLWLHDKEDKVCPYEDTLAAQQMHLPNVEFVITKGLGHSNIYRDNAMQKKIIDFFME